MDDLIKMWPVLLLLALNIYQAVRYFKLTVSVEKKKEEARADALKRSKSVTRGQVAEQMVPLLEWFPYSPGECKFLGQPIDYVVFDGMNTVRDTGQGDIKVIFLEVKQGKSQRSKVQNRIKQAIEEGRVKFETIKLDYDLNLKTDASQTT